MYMKACVGTQIFNSVNNLNIKVADRQKQTT